MQIEVVPYDDRWPDDFELVRAELMDHLVGLGAVVEHVGSTSVPDLPAKPVLDIDVVVSRTEIGSAIAALARAGYVHRGELGIDGRHAFEAPAAGPRRNVYVCVEGGIAVRNHLAARDVLRADAGLRRAYGELKLGLAKEDLADIDEYIERKSPLLQEILSRAGFGDQDLQAIEAANRAAPQSRPGPDSPSA